METTTVEKIVKETTREENGVIVKKSYEPILVHSVEDHKFKDNQKQITIKQVVNKETIYQTRRISNSLNDSIFEEDNQVSNSEPLFSKETRVVFRPTKNMSATKESVEDQFKKYPEATLYRIMSNHPILIKDDEEDIKAGFKTKVQIAVSQICKYPTGHEKEGQVILTDQNKVQYRRIAFSTTFKEDIDYRNNDPKDMYVPEEIKALYSHEVDLSDQEII